MATPFPYLLYFPLKVYLGQLSAFDIAKGFVVSGIWVVGVHVILRVVWQKGLKIYTAQGR